MQNRYRTDAASMFGYRPHPTLSYKPHPALRAPLPLEGRGAAAHSNGGSHVHFIDSKGVSCGSLAARVYRAACSLAVAAPRPFKGRGARRAGWGL